MSVSTVDKSLIKPYVEVLERLYTTVETWLREVDIPVTTARYAMEIDDPDYGTYLVPILGIRIEKDKPIFIEVIPAGIQEFAGRRRVVFKCGPFWENVIYVLDIRKPPKTDSISGEAAGWVWEPREIGIDDQPMTKENLRKILLNLIDE